jgi:proline racemase
MALLHDRGELAVGDSYRGRSIIDSVFDCTIAGETYVASVSAIIPTIRGRAWVYGISQFYRDPRDPWPLGYKLSDTWPSGE